MASPLTREQWEQLAALKEQGVTQEQLMAEQQRTLSLGGQPAGFGATNSNVPSPAPTQPPQDAQQQGLLALSQLPPEQLQQVKNLQQLSQLSPEEQQSLRDMKAQQQAQAERLAPMANMSPEEQQQLREMRDYATPRGLIDFYTRDDGSIMGVREDGSKMRVSAEGGQKYSDTFLNTNDALITGHEAGEKTTTPQLQDWWTAGYKYWRNDPVGFRQWAVENPDMATRWYSLAQTGGQNLLDAQGNKVTNKDIQSEQAQLIQAAGIDPKEDGKYYVTDYSTDLVKDVNTEWGGGDFWKTGTMQTKRAGSVVDFVEENPLQAVAAVGALFVPALAPMIAPYVGGTAVASGLLTAGLTGVAGGDLEDVLIAGVSAYGMEYLLESLPEIVSAVDAKTGEQFKNSITAAKAVQDGEESASVLANLPALEDFNNARDLIDKTQANQNPMDPYQVPKGDATDNPFLNPGDIPTSDTPGEIIELPGLPGQEGGGGSPAGAGQGGSQAAEGTPDPGGLVDEDRDPETVNDDNGSSSGLLDYQIWEAIGRERDPAAKEALIKEYERYSGDKYDPNKAPEYQNIPPSQKENPSELDAEKDKVQLPVGWVWGKNEWGDDIPIKDAGDGDGSGLALGGGIASLAAIINQIGNPNNQGNGTGGTGGGNGGGNGTGNGTGDGPGTETTTDTELPDVPPGGPVPPGHPGEGKAWPQDMSTLYQKPGFGLPPQKPKYDFPEAQLLAPMITAAENSDQASFNEWLMKYLEAGGDAAGLLSVFGASPMLERSGLI